EVRLGTEVAAVTLHEAGATDVGRARTHADTRAAALGDTGDRGVRVDLLGRPRRADAGVDRQLGRQAVRHAHAEPATTIPVVTDVVGHAVRVAVEVVDTEGEDVRPRDPVVGVEVERLEVVDALGDVVTGLVTGAVHTAGLDEQRAELEPALDVEQPGAHASLDRVGGVVQPWPVQRYAAALTPLVEDRRIQRERTRAPAGIDT